LTRALVLAAGKGTRLAPLTNNLPKCLVPIAGAPLLDRWHDALTLAKFSNCLINVCDHQELIADRVACYNRQKGTKWSIATEPTLLGTARTTKLHLKWLDLAPVFLIIYADNVTNLDLAHLMETHLKGGAPVTMVVFESETPWASGIVELDTKGVVTSFVEKPKVPPTNLANAGILAVSRGALEGLIGNDDLDLSYHVLPKLVGKMKGYMHFGYHRDIGTTASLAQAEEDFAMGLVA
jgi:NDP-sugar pyrophosphorylase family protein